MRGAVSTWEPEESADGEWSGVGGLLEAMDYGWVPARSYGWAIFPLKTGRDLSVSLVRSL